MLLYQFVCPSAKELKQMTMAEFGLQAAHNAMFVGVVDVDATPKLGVNKISIRVFNEPTLYRIPKSGFMLVKDEEEIVTFPFANLIIEKSQKKAFAGFHVVSPQEPQSYNNGQALTLNVRPVKFKDRPDGVEVLTYDRNPKDTEVE